MRDRGHCTKNLRLQLAVVVGCCDRYKVLASLTGEVKDVARARSLTLYQKLTLAAVVVGWLFVAKGCDRS